MNDNDTLKTKLQEYKDASELLELECVKAQTKIDTIVAKTIPELQNVIRFKRQAQMLINQQIGIIEQQLEQQTQTQEEKTQTIPMVRY